MSSNNSFLADNRCSGRVSPGGDGGDDDDFLICVSGLVAFVLVMILWIAFSSLNSINPTLGDNAEQPTTQVNNNQVEPK